MSGATILNIPIWKTSERQKIEENNLSWIRRQRTKSLEEDFIDFVLNIDKQKQHDLIETVSKNLHFLSDRLSAFERERQSFHLMRGKLKIEYSGKYVAIHDGRVVDCDVNESSLIDRFYKTYGNVAVYIDKPEEKQRIPKVITPRKVK
jgi:hypothetical protein